MVSVGVRRSEAIVTRRAKVEGVDKSEEKAECSSSVAGQII